jgi:hypothetical protein
MRSGPRGGYDFSRKRDYRRKVWATFRDTLKRWHVPVVEAQALLMPSLEGDEIDVALNAGFREANLHVVDHEPAIVATLKKRYPTINTYGVTASRAFERLSRSGVKIRCANLDFCSQISKPFGGELAQIALLGGVPCRIGALDTGSFRVDFDSEQYGSGVLDDQAVIAVSVLRGRESRSVTEGWDTNLADDAALRESAVNVNAEVQRMLNTSPVHLPSDVLRRITHVYRRFLELSAADRHRVATIWWMLQLETKGLLKLGIPSAWKPIVQLIRTESYLSTSGQTMLWSIWEMESARYCAWRRDAANAKRISMGIAPT